MAHRRLAVAAGTAATVTALAAALLSAPLTPALATGAPTVTVDKQCYVAAGTTPQQEVISGSGWTPGDQIEISDSKNLITSDEITVGSNGIWSVTVGSPPFDDTQHAYDADQITATDATQQNNGQTPTTATSPVFDYTTLAVNMPSSTTHLGSLLKYSFVGFNEGSRVYGHYIFKKKLRATFDFGKVTGPCGLLSAKARIYPPSARPAVGDWTVQFDNSPHYSSTSLPRIRYGFEIYRY